MNPNERLTEISAQDLMALGVNDIAYVKPVVIDGETLFAVHAADGTQMALFKDHQLAVVTARRHDLEVHSVH